MYFISHEGCFQGLYRNTWPRNQAIPLLLSLSTPLYADASERSTDPGSVLFVPEGLFSSVLTSKQKNSRQRTVCITAGSELLLMYHCLLSLNYSKCWFPVFTDRWKRFKKAKRIFESLKKSRRFVLLLN